MAMEIGTNIANKVAATCIDKAMEEAGYLCCFKSYVEDYEKEQSRLLATRESLQKDINEARQRNEIETDDETQQWLKEANDIINVDTKAKKKWFGFLTDCIWQYKRGKELAGKTLDIPKLMERRNNLRIARSIGAPGMEYHSSPHFIQFQSRKAQFEQLKEALKKSNNHLVGLQGMGGTGKTTMATQVEDAKNLEDAESLWFRLSNGEEKILIILDDVWQELNLRAIGIPLGFHQSQKGHCNVLLTTRYMTVCKRMECQNTINLELLSGVSVDSSSTDMRNIALSIVKECGKLPVAIVPVAKTLKFESLKDWEAALIRLQNFDPTLHAIVEDLVEAYKSLKLSYDNLKNEKAKELFLLCSLFPEDFELPMEELSRFAIGLGLCGNADNYYIARSQVPEITHTLIDSSLMLKADEDECVKMHDLVREVAQWIGKDEIQVIMDSKTILKENIRYSFWNIDCFPNHFDGKKLEFLWVKINAEVSMELLTELFKDMIRLRVLILIAATDGFWNTLTLSLPLSFQSLRNIRTLILEKWELGDISIMGSLQSLETLELNSCKITKLPNEIQALEKLRLLSLRNCEIERDNPFKVIEGIPKLEELCHEYNYGLNLNNIKEGEEINQVGTFPALQRYQIIQSNQLMIDASSVSRCFSPGKLLKIFSEAAIKDLAARADCLVLEEYHKTGWTNLIPDIVPMENGGMDMLFLYKLSEIECVIHTKNLQSGVPIFSKLVDLNLVHMDVKELCCGPLPTDFLKQLEELYLSRCMKLEGTLLKGKLDLGKLKSIVLDNCSMSSLFHPSTARSLKQLKRLGITECKELKYIITNEGGEEEKVDVDDDNIFPSLEVIEISHVPNFINILECQAQSHHHKSSPTSAATVRDGLNIVKDGNPRPSYTLSWARLCCCSRPKPSATTKENPCVSEPTLPNHTCSLSQASKTELVLDRVQCLLRPPLNPHNMREMKITHCSNLTSLLTFPIASSMLFLEKLKVKKCRGLKHLITDEGDGHDHMNKSSIFPKLQKVSIKNCRLLESLFPASHCTTFDHLVSVKISRAHKLRYVFGKCYCNDMLAHHNRNVEIHLPTLNILFIHDVPNMVNFCYENSYITALSLKKFSLIECPQLLVKPLPDLKVGLHETQENLSSRKVLEIQQEKLTDLYLNNVNIEMIYDLEKPQIKGPMISMLESMWLKNLPELSVLPNLGNKKGETKEMIMKDVFPRLETLKLVSLPSLDCVCQGIDFQTVPELFVLDCPNISLTSTMTIIDDDVDDKNAFQHPFLEISSEDEEILEDQDDQVKATSDEVPFQSKKEETMEIVDEDLEIQEENNHAPKLTKRAKVAANEAFKQVPSSDVPAMSASSSNSVPQQKPLLFSTSQTQSDSSHLTKSTKEAANEVVKKVPSSDIPAMAASSSNLDMLRGIPNRKTPSLVLKESMDSSEDLEMQDENNNTPNLTESNKAAANEAFIQVPTFDIPAVSVSSSNSITQQKPSLRKKEATKGVVDEDIEIQEQNNNTSILTESNKAAPNDVTKQVACSDIPAMAASSSNPDMSKEREKLSVQEGLKLQKEIIADEIMDSEELSKPSLAPPFISLRNESPQNIEELREKKPRGDREALKESISTNEAHGRVYKPANEISSIEGSNENAWVIPPTIVEIKDSTFSPIVTFLEDNSPLISTISSAKKPQAVTAPTDTEPGGSKSNNEDISSNTEHLQETEIDIDEGIKVEDAKPEKFEEDDLTRLFRIMEEEDTDMGVGVPYVSNIAAGEDDNKVARAFANLEVSLKMGLNEIANSEEDILRLQNALNILSSHFSKEDGASVRGLSTTIDSLHQEIQSIISSFKQASSAISTFTELEGKEKHMINEELPQRKKAANTLHSEIDKTEKSMDELKEQILRLQAELNRKEKEFKECEIKLSCLQEKKKKSVWDNMGFMKEFVDVKKDSSTTFGTPTLLSNTLPISPAVIAGTAYSVKLTVVPPSSPFLNTALLPVKSSSKTTRNPYTSLFVVNTFGL
ncbi:putative disease resistance protein [Senna tora]|uniref:Putative disease resistance protein n=1 Tax=Senna tora TaxID=362788 RepID=A0A834XEK8_9FABA|nr:putative disease resistance protein [Senna tora]